MYEVKQEKKRLSIIISSRLGHVERVIESVKGFMSEHGYAQIQNLRIVLRELLINAVEHGNKNEDSKRISCILELLSGDEVKLTVEDEGDGFDPNLLNFDLEKCNGNERRRGYPLIHSISKDLSFNKKGNKITANLTVVPEKAVQFLIQELDKNRVIIIPQTNLTALVADQFRETLVGLFENGINRIVFNLEKVQDVDSICIAVLLSFGRMIKSRAGTDYLLQIDNASREIQSLLKLMGLLEFYRFIDR